MLIKLPRICNLSTMLTIVYNVAIDYSIKYNINFVTPLLAYSRGVVMKQGHKNHCLSVLSDVCPFLLVELHYAIPMRGTR
jgi:hypothetical protein